MPRAKFARALGVSRQTLYAAIDGTAKYAIAAPRERPGRRYCGFMSSRTCLLDTASDWLDAALSGADGPVVLTSPYLTFDVCKRIEGAASTSSQSWLLLTTLDPSAVANGYLSVRGLALMLDAGIEVRHVARLHAKCFIVGTRAMLGSANLTSAGLGSTTSANRELGVELDAVHAQQASEVIAAWPSSLVRRSDLDELLARSESLTRDVRGQSEELDVESALRLAEGLLADARDPERSLWLKLEYGAPLLDGWRRESLFASPKKGKPGFRPGDLVFICANETRDCYAVVEATSDPEFQPQDYVERMDPDAVDRWPWVTRTRPRLVPSLLVEFKREELGASGQGLQNGHVRLDFDEFTAGVRALARLMSE